MRHLLLSCSVVTSVACFRPALPRDDVEADGADDVSAVDLEVEVEASEHHDSESRDGNTDCTNDEDCSVFGSTCASHHCEVGVCVMRPKDGDCDDGDLCTTGDRCDNGTCVGEQIACASFPCMSGVCDPLTGGCVQTAVDDGGECDDGHPCTVGDSCVSGNCVPGPPPDDRANDWVVSFRSDSPVSVGGVNTMENGVVVAISVGGGNPLNIDYGGQDVVIVSPDVNVSRYIVVALLDADGRPVWARVVLELRGEASAERVLAIRGGPFVHAGSALTLGYMQTEELGGQLRTNIGILRLGFEGSEVWRRTVEMAYPEPADLSFPHVCASPGGRVAAAFPVLQDELGSFDVLASRDGQLVEDLTGFSSAGLSSGVVTWSPQGSLEQVGWVRSDTGQAFSLSCAIRDEGGVIAMGFGVGDTLVAEATNSFNEIRRAKVLSNEQFGWAAAFSGGGLPTSAAIIHSSVSASEGGLSTGYAFDQGVVLAGLFQGAVSVVSSNDGTLRSLPLPDPGASNDAPMAAVLELDQHLRLRAGTRIEARESSWVQTVSGAQDKVIVAGGGRGLVLGDEDPTEGRKNYFVSVLAAADYRPVWSLGLADLDAPLTGDFALGPLVVESVSAARLDESVVVGMTVKRPLSLAPHGDSIAVGGASTGLVARRNSAGGLECLAR